MTNFFGPESGRIIKVLSNKIRIIEQQIIQTFRIIQYRYLVIFLYNSYLFINLFKLFLDKISPALPPRPETLDTAYAESTKKQSVNMPTPPSSPSAHNKSPPPPPNHVRTDF